ncbi:MAG: S24/S26 family peptidase [Bacilli bacterium]|nr:S24/S26 family peptidase [Bacilli bacterium]
MQSVYKFEEVLEKDGELFFTNIGFSMYPLIKQREDILHIKKSDGNLKKGDIVLYKSHQDHYVLHRILKLKKDKVICAGDYNHFKDEPISKEAVLGKLVEIKKKDGTTINLNKDKKARKFFYTNFFYIKAFFQLGLRALHLRKTR